VRWIICALAVASIECNAADHGTLDAGAPIADATLDRPADATPIDGAQDHAPAPPDTSQDLAVADLPPPDPSPDGPPEVAPDDAPTTPTACGREPSARNVVIPVFGPIFAGSFPVVYHFDHDQPKEFTDRNGFQIDWCGRRRTREIDGHSGYDFKMPEGTPLLAPADGVINWAGFDIRFFCPLKNREVTDQLRVEITHTLPDGRRVTSNYKHLSRVDVQRGQRVTAGTQIGLSGNTGCSTGPHLHFENWVMDGTRTGRSVLIDAFGWEGEGPDPWAGSSDGSPSMWLWKSGQAPDLSIAP
jgi:murein DD-endopeptidase MepM/ murein hydrolase activator NlpD